MLLYRKTMSMFRAAWFFLTLSFTLSSQLSNHSLDTHAVLRLTSAEVQDQPQLQLRVNKR